MKKKDCPSCVMRGVFKTFCVHPYRLDREDLLDLWDEFQHLEQTMMLIVDEHHWCETHRRDLYWSPDLWKEVETTSEDTNQARN